MLIKRWVSTEFRELLVVTNVRGAVLISWTGMRGLVTLATAFALPEHFPQRDLIVLCAFCVVLGTLVMQGVSAQAAAAMAATDRRRLGRAGSLHGRVAIMQAALDSLDGDPSPAAAAMRDQYTAARTVAEDLCAPQAATEYDELRLRAIAAQRQALHRIRAEGRIGDDAFHRLQEELDWAELDAAPAGRFQPLASWGADNLFRPVW